MKNTLIALTMLAAATLAAEPMDHKTQIAKLDQMSVKASTAADHAEVAKQFRLRAEALEAEAARHEAEYGRLRNAPGNPMAHKWPAMAPKTWEKSRQLAMHARRAAEECRNKASNHYQLAVERGFGDPDSVADTGK